MRVFFTEGMRHPKRTPGLDNISVVRPWVDVRAYALGLKFVASRLEITCFSGQVHDDFRPDLVFEEKTSDYGSWNRNPVGRADFVLNPGILFGCLTASVKISRVTFRLLWRTHFFDKSVSAFS